MEKIKKLFRKISKKDREAIVKVVEKLIGGDRQGLNVKKIEDTDFLRARQGRYRIIFHYEEGSPVIDSIKARNEKTYDI